MRPGWGRKMLLSEHVSISMFSSLDDVIVSVGWCSLDYELISDIPPTVMWSSSPPGGAAPAPYLVDTIWVLQPGVVHLLHVVGARPVQKRLRGHGRRVAPDWLKRPCGPRGGECEGALLAHSLSRLGGGERAQPRRASP